MFTYTILMSRPPREEESPIRRGQTAGVATEPSRSDRHQGDSVGAVLLRKRRMRAIIIANSAGRILYLNTEGGDLLFLLGKKMEIPMSLPAKISERIGGVLTVGGDIFGIRAAQLQTEKKGSALTILLVEKIRLDKMQDLDSAVSEFYLTRRETDVLRSMIMGSTNKEIGNRLSISENTVKDYIRKIMIKVGATTRTGVISRCLHLA